jgi:hypothetical protein
MHIIWGLSITSNVKYEKMNEIQTCMYVYPIIVDKWYSPINLANIGIY